jgi:hypothetical protein
MEQVGSIAGLVALIVSIWALAQNRAANQHAANLLNELSEAHKDERRRMNRVIDRLLERVI